MSTESRNPDILPVSRSKQDAKLFYNRISRFYDYFIGIFERKHTMNAVRGLRVTEGEIVLEIGCGSGYCLSQLANSVGETGMVYGVDISPCMLEIAKQRLDKAGLKDKVALYCEDAINLPFDSNIFDAVFMSFTLELFDTPEIPVLLNEIKRVLRSGGRISIVSMSRANGQSLLLNLYEWAHRTWPKYIDCRPVYLEQSLNEVGFKIWEKEKVRLFSLPCEIVIAEV